MTPKDHMSHDLSYFSGPRTSGATSRIELKQRKINQYCINVSILLVARIRERLIWVLFFWNNGKTHYFEINLDDCRYLLQIFLGPFLCYVQTAFAGSSQKASASRASLTLLKRALINVILSLNNIGCGMMTDSLLHVPPPFR